MNIIISNSSPDPIYEQIVIQIKTARESKYMSILDVQEITGLSKSTIRDIEKDTLNSPTLNRVDALNKIANAFHVTTDELLLTNPSIRKP